MMLGPRNYHNTAEHPASMLASLSAGTVASRGWNAGHQAPVGAQPPGEILISSFWAHSCQEVGR